MLSATFFRSRFDKLFYMLKMLRSNLPENKEYLDTILNECIICNIKNEEREWKTNINKFKLYPFQLILEKINFITLIPFADLSYKLIFGE